MPWPMPSNCQAGHGARCMHAPFSLPRNHAAMAKTDSAPPKEASPERVAAFQTGISAEGRAAAFLFAKGYRILAKRFRSPHGEIDLIVRRRNLLAFVEVKARATLDEAAFAVTPRQQARIIDAAPA